ncbi:MAG: hypothetical protein U0T69_12735 [Chitinophagales bacterium]
MRIIITIAFIINATFCLGQNNVKCDISFLREWYGDDTIKLSNEHLLYYGFDCELLSLLKETPKHRIDTIFSMSMGLPPRLNFQFVKEFKRLILFRAGCAGNGPCFYVLTDKESGRELQKLPELIYTGENDSVSFVIYFDLKMNNLIIHNLETGKKKSIPVISKRFNEPIPEYQFSGSIITNGYVVLYYNWEENGKSLNDEILIEIKKYKR